MFRRLPKNPAEGAFERCVSRLNAEAMEDGFSPSVPFPSMALEWGALCSLCAVCAVAVFVKEIGFIAKPILVPSPQELPIEHCFIPTLRVRQK